MSCPALHNVLVTFQLNVYLCDERYNKELLPYPANKCVFQSFIDTLLPSIRQSGLLSQVVDLAGHLKSCRIESTFGYDAVALRFAT